MFATVSLVLITDRHLPPLSTIPVVIAAYFLGLHPSFPKQHEKYRAHWASPPPLVRSGQDTVDMRGVCSVVMT